MGSRVMHMIVSLKVAEQFQFQNKAQFLLGGIAPDAVADKDSSHYYTGDGEDFTRYIDYEAFLKKYCKQPEADYIFGYYTHLITDDLWLKGFYLPWLKNRLEQDDKMARRYHSDFDLLNSKLLHHYKIDSGLIINLRAEVDHLPNLNEVIAPDIHKLLDALEKDMCIHDEKLAAKLEVFTLQQIIGYIETAVQKSLFILKSNEDIWQ